MATPLLLVNPKKRKKSRKKNPKTRTRTIYKTRYKTRKNRGRNPCGRARNPKMRINLGQFPDALFESAKEGFWGGVGAIVGNILSNAIPLPDALKTPTMKTITDLTFGMLAGGVVGALNPTKFKIGEMAAAGAFTVAMYDLVKIWIPAFAPGLPLGQYNDGLLGQYNNGLLGRYHGENGFYDNQLSIDYDGGALGYTNAAVVQDPANMNMGSYSYLSGMNAYEYI